MSTLSPGLVVMAVFYLFAGVMHFVRPRVYLAILPPRLPWPLFLVYASGAVEIVLGALLLPQSTRAAAARGVIALLIAVFPANWHMYRKGSRHVPKWALLLRLPLQLVLIAWAWAYT